MKIWCTITIGGTNKKQIIKDLKNKGINISDYALDLLNKTKFQKEKEKINLVKLSVKELGLKTGATTNEIYSKAKELGLELCPAEVGAQLRLQWLENDWIFIAMRQITYRDANPYMFYLYRDDGGLWLNVSIVKPSIKWYGDYEFVFRLRKLDSKKLKTFDTLKQNIIYHTQNCPVYLAQNGQWGSSMSPYCNCNGFSQSGGSGLNTIPHPTKEKEPPIKTIYKVFLCKGCWMKFAVPISFRGEIQCEHDKFSTGSIKELVDVYEA